MKRGFESIEISDDEWSNHDFDSSRILNKPSSRTPPPPIESFAFRGGSGQAGTPSNPKPSFDYFSDSSDCVEVIKDGAQHAPENLEDDDFGEAPSTTIENRGRRFVIDDEDDEAVEDDAVDLGEGEDGDSEDLGFGEEVDGGDDIVGKALHKCAKLSTELRRELYGSSSTDACDRYAEVESSSVRIVTNVSSYLHLQSPLSLISIYLH